MSMKALAERVEALGGFEAVKKRIRDGELVPELSGMDVINLAAAEWFVCPLAGSLPNLAALEVDAAAGEIEPMKELEVIDMSTNKWVN